MRYSISINARCGRRADGYVVNWLVQPGTMLSPVTAAAAGTFVDTSDIALVAVFPQNYLTYVEKGDAVEIVSNPYPGTIFNAKVDHVIPATGGGRFAPSGTIPNAAISGRTAYMRRGSASTTNCRSETVLGSGGSAAIYTTHGKPVHIISKVVMRMKKWLAYVVPSAQKP